MKRGRIIQPISVCFVQKDDRVLLLRRRADKKVYPSKWDGVGGKVDPGETPHAACVREVREEAGLTVRGPALRAVLTIVDHPHDAEWIMFAFRAKDFAGMPPRENDEGTFAWVPIAEVGALDLVPDLAFYLGALLSDDPGVVFGHFEYDRDGVLTKHVIERT